MKTLILKFSRIAVFGLVVSGAGLAYGQFTESRTTTITSSGTVSEFKPDAIAVKVSTSPVPVRYSFTKTTTYVDEAGNPVSVETVKTGAPVEVFYEKNGDNLIADKVVVKKSVSTTTTTDAPAPAPVPSTASNPPMSDGIVADSDSDELSINTPTTGKIHYKAHDSTAYVDENGNPVPRSVLKEGTPVTVFYERDGDDMVATRVVVRSGPAPGSTTIIRTEETTR